MKSMRSLWLLITFLLLPLLGMGQKFKAKNMGVEKGLSESTVRAIMQDKDGFLWLGSRDGLNRFDGYSYDVFRYKPGQKDGLGGNFIGALYQDRSGAIWVGDLDRGGITRLDPTLHKFSQIADVHGKRFDTPMADMLEDAGGNIWLATLHEISLIRQAVGKKVEVDSLQVQSFDLSKNWGAISDLAHGSEGKIWMASSITKKSGRNHLGGIGLIDSKVMDMDTSLWNPKQKGFLPDNQINSILQNEAGNLWIGTVDSGLFLCKKPLEKPFVAISIPHAKDHKRKLGDQLIHALEQDSQGNLWVATHHGLFIMPRGKMDSLYKVALTNLADFPLEEVWTVKEDNYGNIWVGASDGCYQLVPLPLDFAHYYHIPQNLQSLISNDVLAILERKNGEIWIGTGDQGITRMIPKDKGFEYVHYNQENSSIASDVILGFLEDSQGRVFATSFAGLFIFSFETQLPGAQVSIENLRHEAGNPHSLPSNYIYNIIENQDGSYWLSDYLKGASLIRFTQDGIRRESFSFKKGDLFSLQSGYTTEIMKDHENRLWVLGKRGISLMYQDSGRFVGYRHIFNENLTKGKGLPSAPISFYRDKKGYLWVGASGLNRISLREGWEQTPEDEAVSHELPFDIKYYGKDEGLTNELIYFIQPDSQGVLWLGSSDGLIRFDPEEEQFKTFTSEDGFQSNEFSGDASFLGMDGRLYVGGINGFNVFHPDSLKARDAQPRVIIRGFRLFGEEVLPKRELQNSHFILPKAIHEITRLDLSFRDKVLGFELGTDDFTAPEKQIFAYRIKELDENWISLNDQRALTLTNLSAGSYLLEFRCTNSDGDWSQHIRKLELNIAPPWWQQVWFKIFTILLGAGIIYLLVAARIRTVRREMRVQARVSQAKIEEREQTRAETSRDFHDEAGNRITKIGLYANLLREAVGEDQEPISFIEKIEDHTRELSARMRDFIWVLDPNQDELEATLIRIRDFGANLFEHTSIEFETRGNWKDIPRYRLEVKTKRHLLMIAKEAFHNALKYSDCRMLRMDLRFEGSAMRWEIMDDGLGFNLEKASQGMGLRNMRLRAEELGADFKIDSRPGMGTRIYLGIDLHKTANI